MSQKCPLNNFAQIRSTDATVWKQKPYDTSQFISEHCTHLCCRDTVFRSQFLDRWVLHHHRILGNHKGSCGVAKRGVGLQHNAFAVTVLLEKRLLEVGVVLHCKKDVRIQEKGGASEAALPPAYTYTWNGASQLKHMHRMHSSLKKTRVSQLKCRQDWHPPSSWYMWTVYPIRKYHSNPMLLHQTPYGHLCVHNSNTKVGAGTGLPRTYWSTLGHTKKRHVNTSVQVVV